MESTDKFNMANYHNYIAIDLGAESGRVILGTLDSERIQLEEIHRFANGPVMTNRKSTRLNSSH